MGRWTWQKGLLLSLIIAILTMLTYVPQSWIPKAEAFADTSTMSDQQFFGVWNAGASAWTTASKINYAYSSALLGVESAVKAGNYTLAKSNLLSYYRTRTGHGAFPLTTSGTFLADLVKDNILTAYGEYQENTFTVGSADAILSTDVTGGVKSVLNNGAKEVNYYLMGRYKDDTKLAQFNSREQALNKPVLELKIDDGSTQILTVTKDTYTRPGAYADVNYGSGNLLYVQDSGISASTPFDVNTRRAYLSFDLSGVTGNITSATLKVYGKMAAGTSSMDILVIRTDSSWGETTLKWSNQAANTFSWNGIAAGPNWTQPDSGAFNEYNWIISRFQFIGPLAAAYANSVSVGAPNELYASETLRLMLDFIGTSHTGEGFIDSYNYPRSLDVSFRTFVWPRVYEIIRSSPSLDADANTALLKQLWQTAHWQAVDPAGYTGFNWAVNETKGLYATTVYFPEFAESSLWKSTADQRMDSLITSLLTLDGGYAEGSYNYTMVSLQSFYDMKRLADLNGTEVTQTMRNGILKLAHFQMDSTLPNGYDPVYGDGHYASFAATLKQIGNDFGDEELKYVGSVLDSARIGSLPKHTSSYYPDNLSVTLRSGWDADDSYMYFTNRAGPHGHPDQNAVIAYAYGKVLLTDTGVNSYLSSDPVSNWQFNSTESHNTVRINGLSQNKYKDISSVNKDTIDRFRTNGSFDFTEGTTYATPGFAHTRSVLFLRPDYWIVSDRVVGSGTNSYEVNWHMLPGANATLDPVTKKINSHFASEPNIQIVPADPTALTTASLNDGYYDRTSVPNMKFGKYGKSVSGDASFDTVLYPTDTGVARNVQVTRLTTTPSVAAETASALKIDLNAGAGGNTAYYYLSHEASAMKERSFDEYAYDGKLAYIEKLSSGTLVSASIAEGKTLKRGGVPLIQSEDRVDDLGVKWNGTTLDLTGSNLVLDSSPVSAIAIYAPAVSSVTVNGKSSALERNGDYIFAARAATSVSAADRDFEGTQGAGGWFYEKDAFASSPLTWATAGTGTGTVGSDTFASTSLDSQWQWAKPPTANWSLTAAPGKLRIITEPGDTWAGSNNQKNILLQRAAYPDYIAETKVSFNNTVNYQSAGLILYVDDDNYIKLDRAYNSTNGGKIIRFIREYQKDPQTIFRDSGIFAADTFGSSDVYLRLKKVGPILTAFYSGNGTDWTQLSGSFHIPLDAPRIGLAAMNTNTAVTANADFDYFNVTQLLSPHWSGDSSDPTFTSNYVIPGSSTDAVQKWVAPTDGTVQVAARVASHDTYEQGDGFRVKLLKNTANVWPTSGWQTVDKADTTGYAISETITVAKGDVLAFVTNRNSDVAYDVADWSIELTMSPGVKPLSSDFEGTTPNTGWTPLNTGRWAVSANGSGNAYSITATGYAVQGGGRPGEYALRGDSAADRYNLTLKAKLGDDVTISPNANAVVLFDYQDANNYYFLQLDNGAANVRLYKVKGGSAATLADSNGIDWLSDNAFHTITIERDGRNGSITIRFDNITMIRASDSEFQGGLFGIGSMNGKASFDDVRLVNIGNRTDDFGQTTLNPDWRWIREEPANWSLTAAPGKLRISAVTTSDIWKTGNNQKNLLVQSVPYDDFALTTRLSFNPTADYQSAGLLVYTDDDHYIKVERAYNVAEGGNVFRLIRENGTTSTGKQITSDPISSNLVYLKLVKAGSSFTGYFSVDGTTWTIIGVPETIQLAAPVLVGLHAQRSGGAAAINADFDDFRISPLNKSDRFNGTDLGSQWTILNQVNGHTSLSAKPGSFRITSDPGDLWAISGTEKDILLQTPASNDYTITTKLAFMPTVNYQSAGLIVYSDDDNYIKVERAYNAGDKLRIVKETGGIGTQQTTAVPTTAGGSIYLKLVKSGTTYTGYYSIDDLVWTPIGSAVTGVTLPNPRVGLHAQHSGSGTPAINADYDYFEIQP